MLIKQTKEMTEAERIAAENSNNQYLQALSYAAVGMIYPYAGTEAPDTFMICDGTALNVTEYPELFSVIGYTFGGSDDIFNLPDLRGKTLVGMQADDSDFGTIGKSGGEKTHKMTAEENGKHTHSVIKAFGNNTLDNSNQPAWAVKLLESAISNTSANPSTGSNAGIGYSGEGKAHNNLQPYTVINYIIKVVQGIPNLEVVLPIDQTYNYTSNNAISNKANWNLTSRQTSRASEMVKRSLETSTKAIINQFEVGRTIFDDLSNFKPYTKLTMADGTITRSSNKDTVDLFGVGSNGELTIKPSNIPDKYDGRGLSLVFVDSDGAPLHLTKGLYKIKYTFSMGSSLRDSLVKFGTNSKWLEEVPFIYFCNNIDSRAFTTPSNQYDHEVFEYLYNIIKPNGTFTGDGRKYKGEFIYEVNDDNYHENLMFGLLEGYLYNDFTLHSCSIQELIPINPTNTKEWELIEDITLSEETVVIYFSADKMNTKKELHIEGYIVPSDTTVTNQAFSFNDGSPLWQANANCKATGYVNLIMDIYKAPSNQTIFDGTLSVYNYALSGGSFKMAKINKDLSANLGNELVNSNNFAFRSSADNPMTIGTKIKVWGR